MQRERVTLGFKYIYILLFSNIYVLFYLLQKNIGERGHKHKRMIKIGNSASNISVYTCQPKTRDELEDIIEERILKEGFNCDLNDIDTSLIDDMSYLFAHSDFNGDISNWNTSNVKSMSRMFYDSAFNGDISRWDVSNVENMTGMFSNSVFNQDISRWNVSNVENMTFMFNDSKFNYDISNWNINVRCNTFLMFIGCIRDEYKPKILQS